MCDSCDRNRAVFRAQFDDSSEVLLCGTCTDDFCVLMTTLRTNVVIVAVSTELVPATVLDWPAS